MFFFERLLIFYLSIPLYARENGNITPSFSFLHGDLLKLIVFIPRQLKKLNSIGNSTSIQYIQMVRARMGLEHRCLELALFTFNLHYNHYIAVIHHAHSHLNIHVFR